MLLHIVRELNKTFTTAENVKDDIKKCPQLQNFKIGAPSCTKCLFLEKY